MWPVLGWADFPFYYAPELELRPMHAANMLLEVKRWLQKTMPWWDRRGGRDHVWLMPHDEGEPVRQERWGTRVASELLWLIPHFHTFTAGACYMPTEIYNTSIVLTHWGRLDLHHVSGSAYFADYYSKSLTWPGYQVWMV